jgi:hypothetical protein
LADLTDLELAAALAAGYRQQIEQGGLSDEERASAVAKLEEIEARHTPEALGKAWESAFPVITRFFQTQSVTNDPPQMSAPRNQSPR